MKEIAIIAAAAAAAVGIAAGTNSGTFWDIAEKAAQSITASSAVEDPNCGTMPPEERHALTKISANGSFTHNLNTLMPTDKNYMFSPFSIKAALVLAANGADSDTLKQIENVLQSGDINKLNTDIQSLTKTYESLENTEVKIADSIWLNTDVAEGSQFNKDYIATVKKFFNTEPNTVNNGNAVNAINGWCDKHTNGKIKEIIDDPDFMAALVNAVYFNGKWEYQFEKESTAKRTFTDRNGKKTDIDFMNKTHSYNFYKDKDIKVIELPYSDGRLAMYAYLSNDKRVDIEKYFDKLSSKEVIVSIPKFKTEYSRELNDDLQALGITKAFDKYNAEFKKMFEN
ncbi:MAG: hypothetical protein IJR59_01505, partial [Firmicutes bacterium]|nr:hypothetical protein [Bacillota bacterium]